jgi:anti-sigma regulatory factor (Ser/Thr protein kinase)
VTRDRTKTESDPKVPEVSTPREPRAQREDEPLLDLRFTRDDLPRLRDLVGLAAHDAGLDSARVTDFVLAAHELAANSVQHGGGSGTLRVWIEAGDLVCEIADGGRMADESAGTSKPDLAGGQGAGLWIVRQASDEFRIGSVSGQGTCAVMRMALAEPDPPGRAEPASHNCADPVSHTRTDAAARVRP